MNTNLTQILQQAVNEKASDVHIIVGGPVVFRVDGKLGAGGDESLSADQVTALFRSQTSAEVQSQLETKGSTDFAIRLEDGSSFRGHAMDTAKGLKMTLRRLPGEPLPIEKLGGPEAMNEIVRRSRGLVLVTGPTGSGKTTTLVSHVQSLLDDENISRHIYMIEQPTEYQVDTGLLLTQREVPGDCPSFEQGVEDALRADPDVIVIGEMRDLGTMRAAIEAAQTGHLVIATLHTTSAAGTVTRIVEKFPQEEKQAIAVTLADTLLAVLCQQLLPLDNRDGGRVAAYEFLKVNDAAKRAISEGNVAALEAIISGDITGEMRTLDSHLCELFKEGKVIMRDALEKANNPDALRRMMRQTS